MDLSLSKSEQLILLSAREFLKKEAVDAAREAEGKEEGFSLDLWNKMADLGWAGLMLPEEFGGGDGDFIELTVLIEELGRAVVPGPLIWTVCCGLLISKYGSISQRKRDLARLVQGKLIIVPALNSPFSYSLEDTVQKVSEEEYSISARRLFVPYANAANQLLIDVTVDGNQSLVLLDGKQSGAKNSVLKGISPYPIYEVVLDEVKVPKSAFLGRGEETGRMVQDFQEWGALCQSAFILGLLEKVLEMTIEHAKSREQFGRPIGAFQAIQHQCADMATEISKIRLLTYKSAWNLKQGIPATKTVSMAKCRASDASRKLCLLGIKIHGGIGICVEHDMQLFFRMAKAVELSFGEGDFHRENIAQQLLS